MIVDLNKNTNWKWEVCPRDASESRWAGPYVTINTHGDIVLSRVTHEAMGAPEAYVLLYDATHETIGLRPGRLAEKNAYPARPRGPHGGRRIRGNRLVRQFSLQIFATVRFHRCSKNKHGVLILNLQDAEPIQRKKKKKELY